MPDPVGVRLAAVLSRRRLIGAGCFAALSSAFGGMVDARCTRGHPCTPTPEATTAPTVTSVPTDVPTDVPTETVVSTTVPTETPVPTEISTDTPSPTETPIDELTSTPEPTATPNPLPACSQALHDAYVTTGPDGNTYRTWHPLLDTEGGLTCSHRHEHGSNPANLHPDWHPAFEYVANRHGMTEGHVGFKIAVVEGDRRSGMLYHMGSASLARVCVRHHTLEFSWLAADGSLGAVVRLMGDFGQAVHNDTNTPFTPPSCPDQAAQAAGSYGIRKIPSADGQTFGYEPWRVDLRGNVLGLHNDITFNNTDAIVVCNRTPECDAPYAVPGTHGSRRFVTPNTGLDDIFFQIEAAKAGATGEFCTDSFGMAVVDCEVAGSVRQQITPGLVATWACHNHADGGRGGAILVCGTTPDDDINQFVGGVSAIPPGGPN